MPTKILPVKSATKKAPLKKVAKSADAGLPLSVVIRRRIEAQKVRFHANDNISAFIQPGELEGLVDEVAQKMQAVLESLVIDTESDHNTKNTSARVAKMFVQEVFRGRYVEQPTLTKFPNVSRLNELMIIGPITVRSACLSHHGSDLDWRSAEQSIGINWFVKILSSNRMGDVSPADSGRGGCRVGRYAREKDQASWCCHCDGCRSLLYAVAGCKRSGLKNGQ